MRHVRELVVLPIRFYQRFLSPLKPPTCRFEPTCSHYGRDAVLTHGVLKGALLLAWRILRCQPFSAGGYDPVPPPGRWRASGPRDRGEPGESAGEDDDHV